MASSFSERNSKPWSASPPPTPPTPPPMASVETLGLNSPEEKDNNKDKDRLELEEVRLPVTEEDFASMSLERRTEELLSVLSGTLVPAANGIAGAVRRIAQRVDRMEEEIEARRRQRQRHVVPQSHAK